MKAELQINDPREIRNISEELLEQNETKDPEDEKYFGLVHKHYSIVRGRNENSRNLNQEFENEQEHPVEVFRTDGGNSWVHSPESRCYEKITEIQPRKSKKHDELMAGWGREIEQEIEDYIQQAEPEIDINPKYDSGDIYDAKTGKQIGGLSMEIHRKKALYRLCFYDDCHQENHEKFHKLIDRDLQKAENNPEDLRKNYKPLPGFYKHLTSENMEKTEITGTLKTGQEKDNARPSEYCISQQPS